ncbi:hypothetical protein IWQ61_002852 [Dispira simplex]|nr:hypothetical protein IWQ61_002852 [Dispira simplex]
MPDRDKSDKTKKNPVPLLIDFDHARLKNDDVVDQMLSRTAGGSKGKAAADPAKVNLVGRGEAQSVQGGAPHPSIKKKMVHHWVSNQSIEAIEKLKRFHMESWNNFTMVLDELRPEFRRLWFFFHDLQDALFTWEGGSGAIIMEKATAGHMDPQGLASGLEDMDPDFMLDNFDELCMESPLEENYNNSTESTIEFHDPLLERAEHEKEVTENFLAIMMSKNI